MELAIILTISLTLVSVYCLPPPTNPEDGHKYDLEIQKVEPANNTDFVVFNGLKVKRYNKTCE